MLPFKAKTNKLDAIKSHIIMITGIIEDIELINKNEKE